MRCPIVAIIVANEARLVPMPRTPARPLPVDFGLLGTIISQPGSILRFPAILTVPFW